MKIIKSTINLILLLAIMSFAMLAISSTTRVSCEGFMEKSNVPETKMQDKIRAKVDLTILFTKDKAILPGAILSCLRNSDPSRTLCESRTLTQYRVLTLDNRSVGYKYIDSVKQYTETFTGYCELNTHSRAQ